MILQNKRVANDAHSIASPAGRPSALYGNQSDGQRQLEARRKAAAAAQERKNAFRRKQAAAQRLASDRESNAAAGQRLGDQRAEHHAWIDRASTIARTPRSRHTGHATLSSAADDREKDIAARRRYETHRAEQDDSINRAAAARNSKSRPAGHTFLPSATHARPRPTAPTRSFPKATKQPPSLLTQLNTDAKRAIERKKREAEARKEQMRASSDDITDSQAQREAEENHTISKPPPYQSLRPINTFTEANHATIRPRPYEPVRATNTIREPNDDEKSQTDPDDELVLEPSPPPQGPFSLNSAAGIRAIQSSIPRPPPMNLPFDDDVASRTTTQIFMGTPKTKISLKKSSRNQDLLPITASDLRLYQWRAQKINWAEVRQLYSDFTGITPLRSEDSLRTRLRQISKVVEIGVVTEEICERVINGDEQATAELNRLAAQYVDSSSAATSSASLEAAPFRKIAAKQTPVPRGVTVPPPAVTAAPRPTQGGKNLDHDTHIALLLDYADANATEDESSNDSRAGSPLAPEDCVHWEYYMQRRDLYSGDLDNDLEELDDSTPWAEYNASFDHAGHANAEASQWLLAVPEGSPAIFKPGEGYTIAFQPLEDNMSFWSLRTAYGMVQVQVCRRLWRWGDNVMPETKEGWVPKTLYGVFVKKTQRRKKMAKKKKKKKIKKAAAAATVAATDEDDLFGEREEAGEEEQGEEEVEEEEWYVDVDFYQLDDDVYGSLDQANQEAVREWVSLTMKPSSANLDEFACRQQAARQEWQRRLADKGEGEVFKEKMEDDERRVEVFAKKLKMKGARN
ncbi:hypothetical protein Q7P35_000353 [Cladosporium inversicolor]